MKAELQKTITLEQIVGALTICPLADARALLAPSAGAAMAVSGTILKVAKRTDAFRLIVLVNAGSRPMEIYANFSDPTQQKDVITAKVRKNSVVSLRGQFVSFGSHAVVLDNSILKNP